MSNVSHISTVDRGLKMKIKRTKVGANSGKGDTKADGVQGKGDSSAGSTTTNTTTTTSTTSTTQHNPAPGGVLLVNGVPSGSNTTTSVGGVVGVVSMDTKTSGSIGSTGGNTPTKAGGSGGGGGGAGSASVMAAAPDTLSKDKLASPKVKAPFTHKKDKSKDKSSSSSGGGGGGTGGATKPLQGDTNSSILLSNGSTSVGSNSSGGGGAIGGVNPTSGGLSGLSSVGNGLDHYPQITMEPRVAMEAVSVKQREVTRPVLDDPYEFNAKVEDGFGLPPKKLKTETKVETPTSPAHVPMTVQEAVTESCTVGTNTESDLLGPCEPGTSVTLQGIVWQEQTENGLLVVNVTWRDKTYVGTLLDATKNEWAPPRPNCDSPVSDFETRTPKGRGKRGRAAAGTPSGDRSITEGRKLRKTRRGSNNNNFSTPASPARPDGSSSGVKRKARNNDESDSATKGDKGVPGASKRSRSCSRGGASGTESPTPGGVIECPEPNCKKKYKHINGLRYHQTHAHQQSNSAADEDKDDDDDMDTEARDKKNAEKKAQQMSERAERAKAKEQRLQREKQREKSLEKDCSSIEDNIPLKAFASRVNAQSSEKPKMDSFSSVSKSMECNISLNSSSIMNTSLSAQSAMPSTTLTTTTVSSKKKDGGPSMSVSLAVSKTPGLPGQVQQMGSVGCLGGMPAMSSGNTVQAPVIAVPAGSVVSTPTPLPITVAPMGTLDSKDSKMDKSKSKVTTRPIVPAPTPLAMASSGPSGQGLGSSLGHPSVSQALKMIQPKPTIMGEYSSVNPALADLKEKRSKTKKKKEREGPQQAGGASPISKHKEDGTKSDRPAVIKSVASPPMSRPLDGTPRKDGIPSIEVSKPADSPRTSTSSSGVVPSPAPSSQVGKSSDQVRSVQPPGLLKVNSPLHVSAGDRKTPINDDVQSPAYSDISDANDSSSPQQQESPKKDSSSAVKKDDSGSNPPQGDGNDGPQSSYGMYYYNRPSPFMSPNVNTPHASPNSNKPPSQKDKDSNNGNRPEDNRAVNPVSDPMKSGVENPENKDSASKGPPGTSKPEGPGMPGMPGMPPQQLSQQLSQQLPPQQQQQIYQQQQLEWQQKWLQIYSQIRLMPQQAQYQYMAHYGMLDPLAQYILGQQDPHYRQMVERLSQEQKRLQEQQQGMMLKRPEPTGTPNRKQHESRPSSVDRSSSTPEAGPSGVPKGPQPMYGPQGPAGDRMFDGKSMGEGPDDREQREQQALRDKQNENHQILKENIELKSQMDRGRQDMDMSRKQEENRRMMFFQQQQRSADKRKMELHGKPPELKSGPGMDASPRSGSFPPGAMKPEDIKKEPVDFNRVKDSSRAQDQKSSDDKRLGGSVDKGRSSSGLSEPPKRPKSQDQQPGGMGMSVVSSMPSPNHPQGPPGQYAPYPYSVIPSAHYGPMPVDPGHPMYRQMGPHMIGYATAAPHPTAYIHPSQLAYRMGPPLVEVDKEGSKGDPPKPSGPPPTAGEDSSKGGAEGPQGQFYSPVHKIHELANEKSRVRPSSASPAPAKAGEGEARNPSISALSSADKQRGSSSPPTQRHLHTHHHTHVLSHGFFQPDAPFNVAMFAANPPGTSPAPALQPPPFSK